MNTNVYIVINNNINMGKLSKFKRDYKKVNSEFTTDMTYWEKLKKIDKKVRYSFKFRDSKNLKKFIMTD